jgi:hypothetical protein
MTTTSNAAIRKSSILLLAIALVIVSSLSPLLAAQMIFAQSNNAGVSSSNSSNNTMGMMTVLNLGAPLYIEHGGPINIANITPNISNATIEINGTFMLPTGENVSMIGLGYRLVNTTDGLVKVTGQSLIKTIDGKESALFDVAQFRTINSTKGIGTAYLQTNSTIPTGQQQQLASLNNTIGVYDSEAISPTEFIVTFWQSK